MNLNTFAKRVEEAHNDARNILVRDKILSDLQAIVDFANASLGTDHVIARVLRTLMIAGKNATKVLQIQLKVHGLTDADMEELMSRAMSEPPKAEQPTTRAATRREVQELGLTHPVGWMKNFLRVDILNDEGIRIEQVPFDLNGDHPRSRTQRVLYGRFLRDWAAGTPLIHEDPRFGKQAREAEKHNNASTKPRQTGSTTFCLKFATLCLQCVDGFGVLFQMPESNDVTQKLQSVLVELERMHAEYPQYFPPVKRSNLDELLIELGNGSYFHGRHAQIRGGGLSKVGSKYNGVILSEAGKYERINANAWSLINQAVQPAVHDGRRNFYILEGTNDDSAVELNRVAALPNFNFTFVGTYGHGLYQAKYAVDAPETDPQGKYADEDFDEAGRAYPIAEAEYARKHGLLPTEIAWRRDKLDSLGSLHLLHLEYPATYEESRRARSTLFFDRMHPTEAPTETICLQWATPDDAEAMSVDAAVTESPALVGIPWSIWSRPAQGTVVALTGDFAAGDPTSDNTCLLAHDASTGKQIAAVYTKIDFDQTADEMAKFVSWAMDLGADVWANGENNGVGIAVKKAFAKYGHKQNYLRQIEKYEDDEPTSKIWITQSGRVREALLAQMRVAYNNRDIEVLDARFVSEARSFEKVNGKWQAAKRKNEETGDRCYDDYIMCYAMQCELIRWLRAEGYATVAEAQQPIPIRKASNMVSVIVGRDKDLQRIFKKVGLIR